MIDKALRSVCVYVDQCVSVLILKVMLLNLNFKFSHSVTCAHWSNVWESRAGVRTRRMFGQNSGCDIVESEEQCHS